MNEGGRKKKIRSLGTEMLKSLEIGNLVHSLGRKKPLRASKDDRKRTERGAKRSRRNFSSKRKSYCRENVFWKEKLGIGEFYQKGKSF